MSWIVIVWVLIIVFRLIGPNLFGGGGSVTEPVGRATEYAGGVLNRRGLVAGHRGPDARSFKGRAGRGEWWIALVWNSAVGAIVAAIPTIGPILSLPWLVAGLAANARRLHDLKLSAWLQLAPMAATVLALAAYEVSVRQGWVRASEAFGWSTPAQGAVLGAALFAGLAYGVFYIWLGFVPGTRGPNVYGEADPLSGAAPT